MSSLRIVCPSRICQIFVCGVFGVVAQHPDVRNQRDVPLILDRHIDDLYHQRVPGAGALDFDRSGEGIELGQRHRLDEVVLRVHLAEEREVVRGFDDEGVANRHPRQRLEVMLPLQLEMLLVPGDALGLLCRCCHDRSFSCSV